MPTRALCVCLLVGNSLVPQRPTCIFATEFAIEFATTAWPGRSGEREVCVCVFVCPKSSEGYTQYYTITPKQSASLRIGARVRWHAATAWWPCMILQDDLSLYQIGFRAERRFSFVVASNPPYDEYLHFWQDIITLPSETEHPRRLDGYQKLWEGRI